MSETVRVVARHAPIRRTLPVLLAAGLMLSGPARAADPIKIGVIAEAQSVAGSAIPKAVQLAADEINAQGGVDGRQIQVVTYDDKSSASDAVRAFQRAVSEDKVNLVIASYISEVVLALMPWSARLKTPMITPGAASNEISVAVHKDYARNRYTFHGYLTSHALAQSVCDSAKDALVGLLKAKSAAIMSEDAAWTRPLDAAYEECLPKAGLKVVEHVRFSPDTGDFTPIYNKIEAAKPDLIVTGIAHVGVQPTVQWQNQQVPIAMTGISGQATSSAFWANTNGGTQGVLFDAIAVPGVAMTEKTNAFTDAYIKRFGGAPSYAGYMAYDAMHYAADAVKRAGSTDADKLVDALEKTDWLGTVGRIQFYGKDETFTHSIKYGQGFVTGLLAQWQAGKQVAIWPAAVANGTLILPPAVKPAVQ
ncbi:ABC transporter substrate-binding protein [Methylobacterium sp. GXS13]|uniref:ABC transporter substrate-binding protein n=1 Tax=Methylobacterium sp. GXS13 TaxID=1730094 RepID=UPI00071B1534|nr:ABC transporter substrate-binding protein [Methylobacterium sp. GXS13]KST61091.1 ABC transporter substrate-binding protein [Methylobacterium sp. GXS13]